MEILKKRQEEIEEELKELPHGTIHLRKIGTYKYYYLVYRKDGKPTNEYLGTEKSFDKSELENELAYSKLLKDELREIKRKLKKNS